MRKALCISLALLGLAACSSGPEPLSKPDDLQSFMLNPGRQQGTVNDLTHERGARGATRPGGER